VVSVRLGKRRAEIVGASAGGKWLRNKEMKAPFVFEHGHVRQSAVNFRRAIPDL
jgi:hypothetical protein